MSDEPFPGWVEIRLTDAEGSTHAFFDKPPVFESGNELRPDADYPFDIDLDCQIETDEGRETLNITMTHDETPDGRKAFRVAREVVR